MAKDSQEPSRYSISTMSMAGQIPQALGHTSVIEDESSPVVIWLGQLPIPDVSTKHGWTGGEYA